MTLLPNSDEFVAATSVPADAVSHADDAGASVSCATVGSATTGPAASGPCAPDSSVPSASFCDSTGAGAASLLADDPAGALATVDTAADAPADVSSEFPEQPTTPAIASVAIAIDRFEHVVDWRVTAVERKWAGLRSFAPDRLPVYGFDPHRDGLFWFAGQGGFGIQTAPAAARLGAQLLLGRPRDAMTETLDSALYSPARFG